MLNIAITDFLENLAVDLRKFIEVDNERILNPNDFEELCQKIQSDEHFKIVNSSIDKVYERSYMILDNENFFTFYLVSDRQGRFYNLIEMFTYSMILNRKTLTQYELEHKVFYFPRTWEDNNARENEYLMRAFMMPAKAIWSLISKYGDGGSWFDPEKVENATKNVFCGARIKDLRIC